MLRGITVVQYDAPKHRWLPTKLQGVTSDVQLYVTLKEGKHQGRTARALRKLQTDNKGKTALCRWPSRVRDGHLQSVMIPDAV